MNNEKAMAFIKNCCDSKIAIAAICAAPEILAKVGYLDGREYTCYPGIEAGLNNSGGIYVDADVVKCGDLITSKAAGTSDLFAFEIAEYLCGKEKVDKIKNAVLFRNYGN
jgi:putative intracellular protease/amidase